MFNYGINVEVQINLYTRPKKLVRLVKKLDKIIIVSDKIYFEINRLLSR